eukprot:11033424-Lingulodinium_polyedra.AAC.1
MLCTKTGKHVAPARARWHIAGTECIAWSMQGERQGASGPRVLAWWTWAAQRREHVRQFLLALLQDELGDIYFVDERESA